VIENLKLGAFTEHARTNEAYQLEKQLATFPRLAERRHQLARTMSGGEQQMLAIARALMSEPKVLLLDEPSLGLSPRLIKELFATLRTITNGGQAAVLVEQNAHQSLQLADVVHVLENGLLHSSGTAAEMQKNAAIAQAYLGLKGTPDQREPHAPTAQDARPAAAAGGFVNPNARNLAPARDDVRRTRESSVEIIERGQTMGGFYNPYARSVSTDATQRQPEAQKKADAPAHNERGADLTGGFANPYSRSVKP